ncbi:M23 family metallopeptidase [Reichenbachiella agarivorans]|uniref:M23 family metallopeptidase n=1 Tax=Reichenbachiella agarivorans TaxID=2979464 RepID=A0ABY6CMQ7_9BACT|nr:M23 family metallopeptidase [Reichenbachiella agarivorans]UXP31345.1 M23 family metallopeptidase [Reichenbachiella agarivorans]
MRLNNFLVFLFIGFSFWSQAQGPKRGDFLFPVRPNQVNYLAGTMGELRSTHFHAGIDIKTSGTTGLPIYAAADGYVQRVSVSTTGYGNAIYLVHPHNNSVTVYAHLEYFSPEIAAYVREQQYEQESFEVNLFPKSDQFRFKQGDEIAKSGNTGSSSGPHLHFEIRDKLHKILDPLAFGFDEIKDKIPPTISKVAFVTMDAKARINGMFGRFEFNVIIDKSGNPVLDAPVSLYGKIGVEIYAYDMFNGAHNHNGIPRQTLSLDGDVVFQQDISSMEFYQQRNILVHTNYKASVQGSRRFNKLYVDEGNDLDIYRTNNMKGMFRIMDLQKHQLDIRLEDSYGNISQYRFVVNDTNGDIRKYQMAQSKKKPESDLYDNLLEVKADLTGHSYCEAQLFLKYGGGTTQMAYDVLNNGYYLWDLRKGLPDSVQVCDDTKRFDYATMIPSGRTFKYSGENIEILFPRESLFDTTYLRYKYTLGESGVLEVFDLNTAEVPLRKYIDVTLYPDFSYDPERASVYSVNSRGDLSYVGGEWDHHSINFKTRDLVRYTIATDNVPPRILELKTVPQRVQFKIDDDMSGIGEIRAELNGRWLLMNYDYKRKLIWSDEKSVIAGQFVLRVKDSAGNETVFERRY